MERSKYFIHLSYMGTRYRGWQRQAQIKSVQQTIEEVLSRIYKQKVIIHGCGRTDAGVHASQYFAQVMLPAIADEHIELINRNLPDDIAVYDIIAVPPRANAQLNARMRTYTYLLHTRKVASWAQQSALYYIQDLDLIAMQEAIDFVAGIEDFRSLCKSPDNYEHTLCYIAQIEQSYDDQLGTYCLKISANRFLRSMIRYLVARLIDIGKGEMKLDTFKSIILSKEAFSAPFNSQAHAHGLYLSEIKYDFIDIKPLPISLPSHSTKF